MAKGKIGVMDSGIGGLSVVKELEKILPHQDIIYFGDNLNCPYGSKSREQILDLSKRAVSFLQSQDVCCIVIACNTISTLAPLLREGCSIPIFSIVESAADLVIRLGLYSVGLIATEFTVKSGQYEQLIHKAFPECKIVSVDSPFLAEFVDRGESDDNIINDEIRKRVDAILSKMPVGHLILGCTHYPLVERNFKMCYPNLELINPAEAQTLSVKKYLEKSDLLYESGSGSFNVFTSGNPLIYPEICRKVGLNQPSEVKKV